MKASEWIRIRKSLGESQEGLAQKLGMGRSTITKYENGTMEIQESRAISLRNLLKLKESAA